MNKKYLFIGLGILAIAGISVGVYVWNKNKNKKKAETKTSIKDATASATKEQFDKYFDLQAKSDNMFRGISDVRKKQLFDNWAKNLTKADGDVFIALGGKKEKDLTSIEKNKVDDLFKKWG